MGEDNSGTRDRTKQLGAWFLGPKAENASLEEEMILHILRDYFYWRRNYYPSDEITITQHMRREAADFTDTLFQQLSEMLARLRRHFPFYSPRYIAHMLSDQTIPSVLGYFAGMLYNPNNVTPEAAPVTVEWELEVAADVLKMLGYTAPPASADHRQTRKEFGWAHITSGGTVANIEALWVARNVRYFPLAVKRAAEREGIALTVKLPGQAQSRSISDLDDMQCLSLRPNSATFLLTRFIEAVRARRNLSEADAVRLAWEALAATGFSLSHNGSAACFADFPPALFVSGTAHYSLSKAADLLGIGRGNLIFVDVDRTFRLEIRDLEDKLRAARNKGQVPLAVVAIAGTTEEGSIDPVHRIDDFRRRLEQQEHASFWLHVDAAWAGYIRSLFVEPGGAPPADDAARIDAVNTFASRTLEIAVGAYTRRIEIKWGSKEVCRAFLAFPRAESIVVDPHKMGYVPYPCGVVAFRNDRVRHFLSHHAPYITSPEKAGHGVRAYVPPASVGPFILEGSKPGAAAASCWLSHRMIPPDRSGYGEIARASVLAARELYERLVHWEHAAKANRAPVHYRFVPAAALPPDTNIVCFVIQEKPSRSLKRMNALAEAVYRRFTIEAERGEGGYSYSQPFFISRTRFQLPNYSAHSVADLLERAGVDASDYPAEGVFVLRATVMTPYITLAAETGRKQALLAEFLETLGRVTGEALAQLSAQSASAVPL
ncbi:MAG: pyridoxal phosphate-dependent decarboxylase family protein [Rhodospirillales bacterium]